MTQGRRVLRWPGLFVALALVVAFSAIAHDAPIRVADAPGETRADVAGVVRAFVVDNPGKGMSIRHVELDLDDGTSLPLEGPIAETAVAGARVSVAGTRYGRSLLVSAIETIAPGRGAPKSSVDVEGTLRVLHADDFANGTSAWIYELHEAAGTVRRLRLGALPAELAPGTRIRVLGNPNAAGALEPERITVLAEPAGATATHDAVAKAATANAVLVVMANFNNTVAPSYTSGQLQQVMTTNADSVANYFRETSYGQQLMNATVTPGWVTMNLARPATCGSSDWQSIGAAAEAASKNLGAAYDPANYDFVVYVFTNVPACGWLGLAYIGSPHKAWINGPNAAQTNAIAHEMGHNFGLLHAGSVRCSGSIGGTCSVSEYGDPFDVMGNQSAMHYSAMQKAKLGWIPGSSVQTYGGGTVTYTLSPIEIAGASTYAVKIPTPSTLRTYWVEFRQPIGFDAGLAGVPNNGAQVRVAAPLETLCSYCDSWSNDTELVDMTPSTTSFADAALLAGRTFTDPNYGVSITVVAASTSALTVQVSPGPTTVAPTPTATTTSLASSANPSLAGAVTTFTANVSGSAPSGSVRFTDNGTAIAGCAAVALGGSGNVRTASCTTNALIAGTHLVVAGYSGDGANLASTSTTLSQGVRAPVDATNVALASNGGVATASSVYNLGYAPDGAIDGRRSGANWGSGGGWNDATSATLPDWFQVRFAGTRTIDHVVVYSVQDNFLNPAQPTDTMKFTLYGLTDFLVQGWNGSSWVTLGSVSGNDNVKRTVTFSPYSTDRIRIYITGAKDRWSRITEVEAWTSTPVAYSMTNFALATNGGVASASSVHSSGYSPAGTIDGRRSGANWGAGGGWNDGSKWVFPDWLEVRLAAPRTLRDVVVYSVQDNFLNPVEPTDDMTFSLYGVVNFDVLGWNGTSWVQLGTVAANRYIKRTVSFLPFTTDRIRIVVTWDKDGLWSRITEVEAWGN